MRRRWVDPLLWATSWLLLASVAWLSLGPEPPLPPFEFADKIAHGFAYAALTMGFLLAGVWRPGRGPGRYPMAAVWIVLAAVSIGVVIEILQDLESYRSMDAFDALADGVGAAIGAGLWATLRLEEERSGGY
jgi:VanZ family protein